MTIYTVSAAALVPVMGRLGDQVGKMPVYLFGIVVFALGALVVALSGDAFVLLAGRLGQGIGAASLFGTSLAVLSAATPESQRSFVMGFWGAMMALGMSLGPIIGGSFAELISWRGIFVSDLVLSADLSRARDPRLPRRLRAGHAGRRRPLRLSGRRGAGAAAGTVRLRAHQRREPGLDQRCHARAAWRWRSRRRSRSG